MPSRFSKCLFFIVVAACVQHAGTQAAAAQNVAGQYVRAGAARVVLNVERTDDVVRVTVSGGGPPGLGTAVPADCTVVAEGAIRDGRLLATFQPVETDTLSYSRARAAEEKRQLVVVFSRGAADIERADTFGYCGTGIDFLGKYRKSG
jgi:hypothetical protein